MKHKKVLIITFTIISCVTVQSQEIRKNESLRKQLWDLAGYNMNYPEHEIGEPLEKLDVIDDTSGAGYLEDIGNGYLYIRDDGPPCGCYYDYIIGAFKTSDGYVFLKNAYDYCPLTYICSPSRNWEKILPESFAEQKTYSHNHLKNIASLIHNQISHIYPWTVQEIECAMIYLHEIYKEYQKVDFQTITMTWNMEKEHFEIKNIEKHKKINSFLNFLRKGSYWVIVC